MSKLPDGYWTLIDEAFDKVSIYDGHEVYSKQISAYPEHVRHLLAAHWCQSEIFNGGFDQFFRNPTGVLAPEAEVGFRAIGMPKAAGLVATAISRFGPVYPRDREERNNAMASLPNDGSPAFLGLGRCFGDLDDPFYECTDDLFSFADAYARANSRPGK